MASLSPRVLPKHYSPTNSPVFSPIKRKSDVSFGEQETGVPSPDLPSLYTPRSDGLKGSQITNRWCFNCLESGMYVDIWYHGQDPKGQRVVAKVLKKMARKHMVHTPEKNDKGQTNIQSKSKLFFM